VYSGHDNVMSGAFLRTCINQTTKTNNDTRVDYLFTSTDFRNGHGTSIVTTTTPASHLISINAFSDKPEPLAAQYRDSLEPAYEISSVQGRGKGVLAKRRIRMGEIVMVGIPAVLIGISLLADTKPHYRRRVLKQAMNQLPEETRNRAYRLCRSSAKYEADVILGPNLNTVMLAENEAHVGLFTEVAVCVLLTMGIKEGRLG